MIVREVRHVPVGPHIGVPGPAGVGRPPQPVTVVPLVQGDDTRVRQYDARSGAFRWVPASGTHARIPLVAYKTRQRHLPSLMAAGIEVGLGAACDAFLVARKPPRELTLVVGDECYDLAPAEDAYRVWVGIALHF